MANNPIAIDASDLQYYDKQIKKYIDDKDAELEASLSNFLDIEQKVDELAEKVAVQAESIANIKDHIDEDEAAILVLQNDDKLIRADIADLRVLVENKLDESAMEYLATQQFVQDQIAKAQLAGGGVDMTNYYTKAEVDAKIPSLAGYATEDYVKAKIAEAELNGTEVDLSNYYTKAETEQAISDAISNIPQPDLAEYAKKSEIPDVSDFVTNEALDSKGFVTQDILSESYATKDFVNESIASVNEKLDQIAIPTKLSDLENDAGFITEIPSEYVTETELEQKGYLTEHQSLENYATKEFVAEAIASINIPDTSKFITIEDVEAKGYATEQFVLDHVNTQIETEVQTQVTKVVEEQVTELVQTQVKDEVAEQLATNEKINYGTFGEL